MAMRQGDPLDINDRTDERHGTLNGYTNYHCKCEDCRAVGRKHFREAAQRRRRDGLPAGHPLHGTEGGYSNYACRSDPCAEARKAYSAEWRQRRREERLRAKVEELEAEGTGVHRIVAAEAAGLLPWRLAG